MSSKSWKRVLCSEPFPRTQKGVCVWLVVGFPRCFLGSCVKPVSLDQLHPLSEPPSSHPQNEKVGTSR